MLPAKALDLKGHLANLRPGLIRLEGLDDAGGIGRAAAERHIHAPHLNWRKMRKYGMWRRRPVRLTVDSAC